MRLIIVLIVTCSLSLANFKNRLCICTKLLLMVHELELTLLVNLDIEEYDTFFYFLLLKLAYNLLTAKYRNLKRAAQ